MSETNTIKKEYKEIGNQTFEINIYYSLGGYNYFTHKDEQRGYYLSVTPVKLKKEKLPNGLEFTTKTTIAFSGVKELLLEVSRKSKKAIAKVLKLTTDEKIKKLIDYVIKKNNIAI